MPNTFAFLVLYSWPVAVYVLFRVLPKDWAIATAMLGGYLLLPTRAGLDLPVVPAITKDAIPILSVGLMLLSGVGGAVAARKDAARKDADGRAKGWLWFAVLAGLLLGVSPLLTVLSNSEPLVFGPTVLPGMRPYDLGAVIAVTGVMVLPYFVARRHFTTAESHVTLLKVVVLGMLAYSLPTLFEVRMSPQLNIMFYGFFPHDFIQHIRAGGYRPLVFLQHGLWLAILFATAIIAAVALWRQRLADGVRAQQWLFAAIFLLLVLFACRSLGAFALTILILPAVLLLGTRGQLIVAGLVAGAVLVYPMLRSSGVIPVDSIVGISASVSAERAASLQFRLDNEDQLLARAAEKPLTGWGTWGRNQIYDPDTGESVSVTDGAWVILIGQFGWLGYIAQFGLLTLPIMMLALRRRTVAVGPATAGLALMLAVNLLDLIPNATLTPITWLIAGALAGRYAFGHLADTGPQAAVTPATPRRDWSLVTDPVAAAAPAQAPEPVAAPVAEDVPAAPVVKPRRRTPRQPA